MHDSPTQQPDAHRSAPSATDAVPARSPVVGLLLGLLATYALACFLGWPQGGRDRIVAAQRAEALHTLSGDDSAAAADHEGHGDDGHHGDHAGHAPPAPPPATTLPFVLLLAAIAIFPLTPGLSHWWEHNSSKLLVAGLLAAITLGYYTFLHHQPVALHFPTHDIVAPAAAGPSWPTALAVLTNALFAEYVPFIALLFALYVVTGGVRIEGDLVATPTVNTTFLALGALLASFIGTTGAAMLLVRPLLETNKERKLVAHTLVFFIFMVCNCGGLLLPLGDPPLFLGYLEGVDFLWTLNLWKPWLFTNAVLLAVYWCWDTYLAHPREAPRDLARDERQTTPLTIRGLWPNVPIMAAVIAAVALLDPAKPFPGTGWHPWVFLREAVLVGLVLLSLLGGERTIRTANGFNYGAILEVAALFLGIFICMQPALAILHERGASLGLDSPRSFFWATGILSSVLDNAPTYLVFFNAAQALPAAGATMAGVDVGRLAGVSLGAVFLGAMTYIGNGPNFMVKAIAEQSGVRMPSFFGYLLYSFGILLPVFVLVSMLFL
jgi:Na+/H+ antiporter NhaD/arsenite permease-like protein